jgi:hypothetical protein
MVPRDLLNLYQQFWNNLFQSARAMKAGVNPREDHVGFMVHRVAMGQVFNGAQRSL